MKLINLTSILFDQVQRRPEALVVRHDLEDCSYAEFGAMVARVAAGLSNVGIWVGNLCALLLDDPFDHWLATLGLAHMGATVVSLSRSVAVLQRERLLSLTRCNWMLLGDEHLSEEQLSTPPLVRQF